MAAVAIDTARAVDPGQCGPVPGADRRTTRRGPVPGGARPGRAVRSWPLLILAVPAAAEVWSGWVGIAQKTGFGLVSPLPGIWPSLHLDTAMTLPVGVEAYAAYALRAWLAREQAISDRTRRFAKWSAIFSFALGMAGQVAYHLMAQAGMARAPWPITTVVSCLPVLVLGMGTALAHILRADAAAGALDSGTSGPARPGPRAWTPKTGPDQGRTRHRKRDTDRGGSFVPDQDCRLGAGTTTRPRDVGPGPGLRPEIDQARVIARRLAAAGKPVSRRALRNGGVRGSNEALNALARMIKAEITDPAPPQSQ